MTDSKRLSLEKTWQKLEEAGDEMPRTESGKPFVPESMPNYDDEVLGVEFFRTEVEDADYSFLTLPRTFFGRSELKKVNYQNSDLSESRMCWNDFIECDFSNADLSKCDMRSPNFENCNFSGANLKEADLRCAGMTNCNFTGADVTDVQALPAHHLYHRNVGSIEALLTDEQCVSIDWTDDAGEEAPGG